MWVLKYNAQIFLNESTETPYNPVSGPQVLQDAHGQHLLVPGPSGGVARSQPITNSSSGSANESADTPYNPVSGPQVLQDAHGQHLLVPGAGGVGQIRMWPSNEFGPLLAE